MATWTQIKIEVFNDEGIIQEDELVITDHDDDEMLKLQFPGVSVSVYLDDLIEAVGRFARGR